MWRREIVHSRQQVHNIMPVQENINWKPLLNRAYKDFKIDFQVMSLCPLLMFFRATSNDKNKKKNTTI